MKKIFLLLSMATFWVAMQATNIVSLQSVTTSPTEELQIDVSLTNSDALTAVEVKIPLDENMTYVDESALLNTARSNGHIISAAEVDQELRIYIYSLSLKTFRGSEGVLFSFKLKLNEDPAIYTLTPEVVLSNKSGKSVVAKVEAGTITILSPKLEFVTREVNFGHVPIRSNYSRTITLKNVGTSKMNVKSVTIPDSRFVVSETQFAIGVGETKSITLKYSPLEHGPITRQLTVVSDAINKEHAIDVVADPYSINELHVGKVEGVADSIVSLPLTVKNMEPIVGVQFRFKMPNKLQFDDFELSPRTNNYIVLNSQEKDTLSMMLYSLSKTPMVGNDGEIGNLKLKLVGNSGYNYLSPLDVVLSNADEENMVSSTSQGWVRIKSPKLNCETSFTLPSASVTSYASGTYVIQNSGQSPLIIEDITFMSEGFKVVGNLPITILAGGKDSVKIEHRATIEDEYSTIMNIYTNDPDNQVKKVRVNSYMFEPNSLKLTGEPAFIKQGVDSVQGYHLNVVMDNYSEIVAMQFDVHWQANMTTDIDNLLTTARLNGHNCSVTKVNSSTYRVLVFSMSNKLIKNKSGNVVTLGYVGTDFKGIITVDNIILSDAKGVNRISEPTASMTVLVNKLTVNSNDTTMGVVFGGGYFNRGSKVTISAEAKYGYVFSKWSDGSTDTTRTVTLNANTNLTAIFLTNMHTVTLKGENGTVKGKGEFQHGTEIEIEAIPNEGYHFVRWSDGDTLAKRKFVILDNVNLTAEFAINVYKVELKAVNGATQGAGEYTHGSTANINAVAALGYHFVKWSDGVTKAKRSIKVVSDTTLTAEFEINRYTVSVTAKNGKVEGVGEYDYGTIVDLVAVPDEGYHFVQWSDGDTVAERSIAVMSNVSLGVEFAINVYNVELSTENGTVTGAGSYNHGDTITIACIPTEGYHFVKWSDGNRSAEREIVVKSDLNLTAETAINVYTLSLSVSYGTVTGAGKYEHGDTVKIGVTPKEGYHFVKWSDGDTLAVRDIIITSDSTLRAEIAINVYKLSLLVENGTVTGAGNYNHGTYASIRAYSDYGYHFVRWSDGVEGASRSVRMVSDSTITAEMAINVYDVQLSAENGVVVGAGKYEHGDMITISATPNEGYHFVRWSDGNRNAEREVVVTSNLTLKAIIEINVYTVALTAENGVVTGAGKYNHGDIAEISVIPNEGYHFVRWSDGVIDIQRSFKVVSDLTLSAKCAINIHSVVLSAENGTVKGAGEYNYGSKVILTAIPDEGYHFVRWSDGNTDIQREVTIKGDLDLTAEFEINIYKVQLSAVNGVVSGAGEYEYGKEATISVTPEEHYHFVRWSDGSTEAIRQIKVVSDSTLVAQCVIDQFDVTAETINGKVSGVGRYDYGTEIELVAIANNGYHFVRWSDGSTESKRSLTVTSNINLKAEFEIDVYSVTLSAENGVVSGAGDYEYGKAVVLSAVPNEGYHFVAWSDGSTEVNRNIVVVGNLTLTAKFAINVYNVVVNAQNATIEGAGKYEHGSSVEVVVTPNDGYHFVGWTDGVMEVRRQFVVTSDVELEAVVEIDVHTVTLSATNGVVNGAGEYNYGSTATLSVVPNEGYHFVRWSDGDENAVRVITIKEDVDLVAEFAINIYKISLFAENGEVVGSGEYQHGTEIEILATPNEGYHFVCWSDGETSASRVIKVTSDLNLTAIIAINTHVVELATQHGQVIGAGEYNYGTKLTIMAIADEGYHFVGWSDGDTLMTRTIMVVSDTMLTAEFAINVYRVELSTNEERGAVYGNGEYEHGEEITIEAVPVEGYHFVKWSDGNDNAKRTFAIKSDIVLTVEFAIEIREVIVVAQNGTVTGAGKYEYGTEANLVAIPNEGYHFVDWSDGETSSSRSFVVYEDVTLTANFAINVYSVALSAENGNVVGGGDYNHGEEVEIKAIPNEGYHFVAWSDGVTDAIRSIIVVSDTMLTAQFAINVYNVELKTNNGEVFGAGSYEHGAEVGISAIPNEGYNFVRWSDGNENAMRNIEVVSDTVLTAEMAINVYDINVFAENGTIQGVGKYEYGSDVELVAIPNEGYHFVSWSDGETSTNRNIKVTNDVELTAQFEINVYDVVLTTENGVVVGAGRYEHGDTIVVSCIPDEGYHFVRWSDDNIEAEREIVVTEDLNLEAETAINVYTITLSAENGVVTGAGNYEHGAVVAISAEPNEGYHFIGWSDGETVLSRTITVNRDTTLIATFAINVYSVVLSAENGSVVGGGDYNHGEEIEIEAIPNEGYHFIGWSDGVTDAVRTINVTSDITLVAEFAINVYNVELLAENGVVVGAGEYAYGTEVEISVTPNEGYHFNGWSDGSLDTARTIVVVSDTILSADISINIYRVELTTEHGVVTGAGEYEHGSRVTIFAVPDEGYHFVGWSDEEVESTRTLVLTSDTTLRADMSINLYDLILTAENGTITNAGRYEHGAEVEIEAIAEEGYHFVRWLDGDTLPIKLLTMTSDVTMSAYFAINVYDVVLNVENGVVFGAGRYNHGTETTIAAFGDEGHHFIGWSDGDVDMVRTIKVVSDTILTARFEIDLHRITLTAENGEVFGSGEYAYGTEIELRAEAAKNYHFVRWSDGDVNAVRTVVVNKDLNLQAEFALNKHYVILSGENGVVLGSGEYDYSTVLEIKAEANEGYHFVKWSDGEENPVRTIVVTSDIELTAEFDIDVYTVVLRAENGIVEGMGEYEYGTEITITATPDAGYEFVKWSDGDDRAIRTFVITSDIDLVAEFAKEVRVITVYAENGLVVGAGRYEYGTEAILNAIPNEGYHFVRWSDGETTAVRTILVDSDTTLIAEFAINVYSVTLIGDNGEVVGSGEYEHGTEIEISATPNEGYYFVGWSDGDTSSVRTITVLSDIELTAKFVSNLYSVLLTCDNGVVLGGGMYEYGAEVTIIATADEGYRFVKWSDGYLLPERTIVVVSDMELRAEFELTRVMVTVSGGNGVVSGSGVYDYGTEVELIATAEEGYHFVGWSDGNLNSIRTIVATTDVSLTATFMINVYSVELQGNHGKVFGAGDYEHGTEVILTTEPEDGYSFVRWSDGDENAIRTLVVTSDTTLVAEFSKEIREVVVFAENGVVTGGGRYAYGVVAILTAIPNEGYHFVGWSDGVTESVRTIEMLSDTTLKAEFALNVYNVTLRGENGEVEGDGNYEYGSEVEIMAIPNEGYHFVRWSDGDENAVRTIVVTSDTMLIAEFSKEVRMVLLYGENGVVTGAGRYAHGAVAVLSATPNEGYHFVGWSDGVVDAVRTIDVTSDITLVAEFAINTYNVELIADNGKVVGADEYAYGDTIIISVTPNEGYRFVRWSDGETDSIRTIVVTSDVILKAEFAVEVMKVEVESENAIVVGAGEYAYGSTVTLVVIPNEGYKFVGWSDGGTETTRTIIVTSDTLLIAEITPIIYSVELSGEHGTTIGSGEYEYGLVVEIEAIADEGYHFVRWSDGVVDAVRKINVISDVTLVAEFAINMYNVELLVDNGEVVGAGEYAYGDTITISVTPNEGYKFVCWSDGETEATRTIVVRSDVILSAEIVSNVYMVILTAENGTFIGDGIYEYGTEITIVAIPNEGYKFLKWSDGITNISRKIVVTEDVVLSAEFEEVVSEVRVYSRGQILYVEGARDGYYLYDAFGNVVYTGPDNQIFLPHGVYFIKVGWETIKIAL